MKVKSIKISNFKTFKDETIEFGKFNVIIGANASGKSNFTQIFNFLKDIQNTGLEDAISIQGGKEYFRNVNLKDQNFSLEIKYLSDELRRLVIPQKDESQKLYCKVDNYETDYKFVLKFIDKKPGYEIIEDRLEYKCNIKKLFAEPNLKRDEIEKRMEAGCDNESKYITILKTKDDSVDINSDIEEDIKAQLVPPFLMELKNEKMYTDTLLLNTVYTMFPFSMQNKINDTMIYDFDPKMPKKAIPISGKADLEKDGSNLAIILKRILENKEEEIMLSSLIKEFLPFVDKLDVMKLIDMSYYFNMKEVYCKDAFPASLISDGTINITALIVALYFENKSVTIFEEPEKSIHPSLISTIIDKMKEVSEDKQIIVTTHNPEIVKHCGLENILLVSRNDEGYSIISKPANDKELATFLKDNMGVDKLYVQNLLEG